jgi:hypothetical protein
MYYKRVTNWKQFDIKDKKSNNANIYNCMGNHGNRCTLDMTDIYHAHKKRIDITDSILSIINICDVGINGY